MQVWHSTVRVAPAYLLAALAGIEWDDATRGKHDGSVTKDGEVIRLYSCESGRGSFMKLPLLRAGVSMLAALLDK